RTFRAGVRFRWRLLLGENRSRGQSEARGGVTATAERREKLLYGRRKGPKASARQQRLREELLPALTLRLRQDADPKTYFSAPVHEVWLEAGFGAGEHLLWQACEHRNVGMLGAEPYEAGVTKLLSRLA